MLTIRTNEGETAFPLWKSRDESKLWKEVGKLLLTIPIPNQIHVDLDGNTASLIVGKRGTYMKDGKIYPSMFVKVEYNDIWLPSSTYPEAYLTCINPESNNYKFYYLRPQPDGKINVSYGRIGSDRGEAFGTRDVQEPYDSYLYWIRYYEKLSKGYVDMSDVYLSKPIDKEPEEPDDEVSAELYQLLKQYAKHIVDDTLVNSKVTQGQIEKTRVLLNKLGEQSTVDNFNAVLGEILQISPRKARYINLMYANRPSEFSDIVDREENLYSAMSACVSNYDTFRSHRIRIFKATEKQTEDVKRHLVGDGLEGKVLNVYRVIDHSRKEKFDSYVKANHIHKIKQLWHGSRNENWLSIMLNGLQLNPNAQITGKMFGQGIYFAPRAKKSFGYTSCTGSFWAHGKSQVGFMGLFATAYGKPCMVRSAGKYTESFLKAQGKDCVHATPENTGLKNDEIIYYNENAMVLNYIVEFST